MNIEKNISLRNLQFLFVIIFPIATVLGPFPSELITNLSIIVFLIRVFKNKNFEYFKNYFIIFFLIINIYFIINSLFIASNTYMSLESSLFFFRFGLFSIVVWNTIQEFKKFPQFFFVCLLIILTVIIVDSFFQFITGFNFLGYKYDNIRLGSLFKDEYLLGSFIWKFEILVLIFYVYIFENNKKYDFILIFFLISLNILVLLSGERTSFFCMILASFMIIFLTKRLSRIKIYSFIIFFISFLIIVISSPSIKNRMINHTIEQVGLLNGNLNWFSEIHQKHYASAYKMFSHNPIVGVGPKMFRLECKNNKYEVKGACATHPHNFYVQLLAETGIIGFSFLIISFLIISLHLLKILFKKIDINNIDQEVLTVSMICIFVYIWPILPHMNFFNNWINALPSFVIGIILFSLKNKKNL